MPMGMAIAARWSGPALGHGRRIGDQDSDLADGLTGRTLHECTGDVGEPVEGHPRHWELATLGQRGQRVQLLQFVEVGGAVDEARLVHAGLWVLG